MRALPEAPPPRVRDPDWDVIQRARDTKQGMKQFEMGGEVAFACGGDHTHLCPVGGLHKAASSSDVDVKAAQENARKCPQATRRAFKALKKAAAKLAIETYLVRFPNLDLRWFPCRLPRALIELNSWYWYLHGNISQV